MMALLPFAEDPNVYLTVNPDQERILTDRYCVTFSPGNRYWSTSVQRVRFGGEHNVDACVAEIRELMTARSRTAAAWTVGPSAKPSDAVARLLAMGLEPEYGGSDILILTEPPVVGPCPFDIRIVTTLEEHVASMRVRHEGFAFSEQDAQEERERTQHRFESEQEQSVRLVAFDGDRPVATARGWFSPFGIYVGGVVTLPPDRRRGAMSALIAQAWRAAVQHGTPALVAFGGHMSTPTLERMGFRPHGRVAHLIDRI